MMGGSESVDFLAPSGSGENTLVTCENGDFAADLEVAHAVPRAPEFPPRLDAPEEVETPGVDDDRGARRAARHRRGGDVEGDAGREGGRHGRARARARRRPARAREARRGAAAPTCAPATEEEIRAAFGADPGSIGPVGFDGEIVADETLREGQFVAGANRTGWHLRGVEHGRDYQARFADLREPKEGDRCPECGGALRFQTAIEVGHIFKLGTRYSVPLDATFLDEDGTEKPLVMGSYGIGPGRIMAAAVEQLHDENGICWPAAIAPYDVHVVVLPGVEEQARGGRARARRGRRRRPARRPRPPRRREVRRRRPDRRCRCASRSARRRSRTGWSTSAIGAPARNGASASQRLGRRPEMAKRRRFSAEPFGTAVERLMNDSATTYRGLAAKTGLSAGYLNHLVHGNRPVPSNEVVERLADGARRRAGALPRVPPAGDHAAPRGDARAGRPPLPPAERLSREEPAVSSPERGVAQPG